MDVRFFFVLYHQLLSYGSVSLPLSKPLSIVQLALSMPPVSIDASRAWQFSNMEGYDLVPFEALSDIHLVCWVHDGYSKCWHQNNGVTHSLDCRCAQFSLKIHCNSSNVNSESYDIYKVVNHLGGTPRQHAPDQYSLSTQMPPFTL